MGDFVRRKKSQNTGMLHDLLKSVHLFMDFDDRSIDTVLDNASVKYHERGRVIIITGDPIDYLYVVVNGWLKLFRETSDGHESVVSIISTGDCFGQAQFASFQTFSFSCESVTDCSLLQIPASFFKSNKIDQTQMSTLKAHLLEEQFHAVNQRCLEVEHLTLMSSTQRIGCFLLKLCGHKQEGSMVLELPVDKGVIAARLGMVPETFSRGLNQLAAIGVETKKNQLTIQNIEQLRAKTCRCCSALLDECEIIEPDQGT